MAYLLAEHLGQTNAMAVISQCGIEHFYILIVVPENAMK